MSNDLTLRRRRAARGASRTTNIFLDANALDRIDDERSCLVDRFCALTENHSVILPEGVLREIDHPSTPVAVRQDTDGIYSLPLPDTPQERVARERLREIMRGDAAPGRHTADADHLFEAQKYGGGFFVTHDQRILNRKEALRAAAPALQILTLADIISKLDGHSRA